MTAAPPEQIARFQSDLAACLGCTEGATTKIGVAVSGGPDSLALLLLASAACPGKVEAATVDHGLRPESGAEAALVARHCANLGVTHETLPVKVASDNGGVQASARKARYAALGCWTAARGIGTLLTAHHVDDQAETLLMRLLRGSGVAGLSGVRASVPLQGGGSASVHRPLLGWRRSELAAIVARAGFEAIDDPGNRDEAFDRARIRRQLAETLWLDPVAIAHSAAALAGAEHALDQTAHELFAARVEEHHGIITFAPQGVAPELRRRVIMLCLRRIDPSASPRGAQVGALLDRLKNGQRSTLAGIKCTGGTTWRFEPAPPRTRSE